LNGFKLSKGNERPHRVNSQIRISPVVLINQEGRNMGSMPTQKAMDIAAMVGLDLVEIAPDSRPPVCRIMDFGKFKFEQGVKEKKQRKKQRANQVKEVHLSPSIQKHDLETKAKAARRFLESGHNVNIRLEFRRREIAHKDLGNVVMAEFNSLLSDCSEVIGRPKMEGRALCCVLSPKQNSKD
jgi:translation initiation factor IF-3